MLVIQDCITSYTKYSKRGYMNAHHFFRNFMSRGKIPFMMRCIIMELEMPGIFKTTMLLNITKYGD